MREQAVSDLTIFFYSSGRRGNVPPGCPERVIVEQDYADAYHWTPEQVGRLPLDFLEWEPLVRQARARATALRRKPQGGARGQR